MDYYMLLDMTAELGYQLAMSGAETFRVEESANRVMRAYGIEAEAFAIPNCLHISIETDTGKPLTRMRRIQEHGNDLDAVEKYSNLSRRICSERPEPAVAMQWLKEVAATKRKYSFPFFLIGSFLGAVGFCLLFGGGYIDSLCSGICGLSIGLVNRGTERLKVNSLFRTLASSFLMSLLACFFGFVKLASNIDAVIIGALMSLVPGFLFTNSLRDIIYGDINSGINRIVQVFLIAITLALGTAAAWKFADFLWGATLSAAAIPHSLWIEALGCFISGIGFSILFNIHGPGILICAAGGVMTWLTYRIAGFLGCGDILAYFWGTAFAALYAEIMARIRKFPAISYLSVAAFPLIPGAGVYYTMNYAVRANMDQFVNQGLHTLSIAGVMAVGILVISSTFRMINAYSHKTK